MPKSISLPILALAVAAPSSLSAQSVRDFQLPPNPSPTPTSTAQGPVDVSDNGLAQTPRVIGAPSDDADVDAGEAETVQPVPQPTQAAVRDTRAARAAPDRAIQRPAPRPLATGAERLPLDPGQSVPLEPPVPDTSPSPDAEPVTQMEAPPPVATLQEDQGEGRGWFWPIVGGGMLALIGFGYFLLGRRRHTDPPAIERPLVEGGARGASLHDLRIRAEAIKLTRSLMNATLQYRVMLTNNSSGAIAGVTLGADIVSAHGGLPVDQQVASADQVLEKRHEFTRIAPGQSVEHLGQIAIPLAQARLIKQGQASLFVPLLRVRIDHAADAPLVKTFVVGLSSQEGGRVMPFRFDGGPRSYESIAARALD